MKIRTAYSLHFPSDPTTTGRIELPLTQELDGKTIEVKGLSEDGKTARAFVESSVDRDSLGTAKRPQPHDGRKPAGDIVVPEAMECARCFSKFIYVLAFLADMPIRLSRRIQEDRLIPEGTQDQARLEALGTDHIHMAGSVTVSMRTFDTSNLDAHAVDLLSRKETGLAIYYHALLTQEPIAEFRELWKVLESAFQAKNKKLIDLVSKYGPSQQLKFTAGELRILWVLRGRASHADSRKGAKEYKAVLNETSERLSRLKCLVEQVLLTKSTWGSSSLDTERLAPVTGFIGPAVNE